MNHVRRQLRRIVNELAATVTTNTRRHNSKDIMKEEKAMNSKNRSRYKMKEKNTEKKRYENHEKSDL